jgi:hypothetical protein
MLAAFRIKLAAGYAQMLFELGALQASTISSRRVGSCSLSSRFASKTHLQRIFQVLASLFQILAARRVRSFLNACFLF